jgi:hypothetical protein
MDVYSKGPERAGILVRQAGWSIETRAKERHPDMGLGQPDNFAMAEH